MVFGPIALAHPLDGSRNVRGAVGMGGLVGSMMGHATHRAMRRAPRVTRRVNAHRRTRTVPNRFDAPTAACRRADAPVVVRR